MQEQSENCCRATGIRIAAVAAGLVALACGGASPTRSKPAAPVAVTTSGQADEFGGVTSLAGMKTGTATGTLSYMSEHIRKVVIQGPDLKCIGK